jgi:uncharacterized protein YndB with AHSA1/START domain
MRQLNLSVSVLLVALFIISPSITCADQDERYIHVEIVVNGNIEEVFKAWTTEDGVKSFFAPECNIEPKVDGAYNIYFFPSEEPGKRGAEGMRILALEQNKMFSFSWGAPRLLFPNVKKQRTLVVLRFKDLGDNKTKLILHQTGWGEGKEWDKAYEYFDNAWKNVVLKRLQERFDNGSIKWKEFEDSQK